MTITGYIFNRLLLWVKHTHIHTHTNLQMDTASQKLPFLTVTQGSMENIKLSSPEIERYLKPQLHPFNKIKIHHKCFLWLLTCSLKAHTCVCGHMNMQGPDKETLVFLPTPLTCNTLCSSLSKQLSKDAYLVLTMKKAQGTQESQEVTAVFAF